MFLGIEIGGTKLQIGIGAGDGILRGTWRDTVDRNAGPEGIRQQISTAVPRLLSSLALDPQALQGVGIGFGGPVNDATQAIIKSHQIDGWDHFPLAAWIGNLVNLPATIGNDADVAGLAEAIHGAGKGFSPIFYITIGSGIGGGFVQNGVIYRGVGLGAAEVGHLRIWSGSDMVILEKIASGWGIESVARKVGLSARTVPEIAAAAAEGNASAQRVLDQAQDALAEAICHIISLLCPRRIVIGGGVSLLGEKRFFEPLRQRVQERVFQPFLGLTDIVPAGLGEEVVVHGAIELARLAYYRSH